MSIPLNHPDDHVLQSYLAQQSALAPETIKPNTAIERKKKYLFRSRPGTMRGMRTRIPGVPMALLMPGKEKLGEFAQKRYERQYTQEERDRFQRIADDLDSLYIEFTKVPEKHECYFETSSDDVAAFIRSKITGATDDWRHIFEDTGNTMIRSKFTDDLFPATTEGMAALYAHDRIQEMNLEAARAKEAEFAALEAATEPEKPATKAK